MAFPFVPLALGIGGMIEQRKAGKRASQASEQERWLAAMMGETYRKYMPGVTSLLWQTAQHPESDPWFRSQMLSAEGEATSYFRGAGRDMMMELARAGGGRLGESSAANNLLLSLATQRGRTLAGARVGQLGEMYKRRMGALGQLGNLIMPSGEMALGSYGRQAEMYAGQESEYADAFGGLGNWLAWQRYNPPRPGDGGLTGAGRATSPAVSYDYLKRRWPEFTGFEGRG